MAVSPRNITSSPAALALLARASPRGFSPTRACGPDRTKQWLHSQFTIRCPQFLFSRQRFEPAHLQLLAGYYLDTLLHSSVIWLLSIYCTNILCAAATVFLSHEALICILVLLLLARWKDIQSGWLWMGTWWVDRLPTVGLGSFQGLVASPPWIWKDCDMYWYDENWYDEGKT